MLETLTRAISTALFFLCTAVVTGFSPAPGMDAVPVNAAITESEALYSLVGTWSSGGKTLEFTPSGKLIFDGVTLEYEQSGNSVSVWGEIDGKKCEHVLELQPISSRVAKLNGVKMYRIK